YLVSLNNISQKNIRNQSFKLKSISQTLNNQVLFNISKHKAQLENISNEIKSKPNRIINSQIKHLSLLENNVEMANPVSILKRGFSISRLNGKLINSSKLLEKGEIIETEFYDGIVKSKVENIENRKTKQ
ncbi:MAG: hypothetical protein GX879_10600, partial [Bacteroidales bacterium]|nr:hypothetical protein [Bacteroidales bacterium]